MGTPRLNLSKYTKAKPLITEFPEIDPRVITAAGIRGLSSLGPGGWPGAGIALAGEGLAQTIEPRDSYNYPQMGAQAALGAIPFGKSGKAAYNFAKGALLGTAGNVITNQAEEGLHIPDVNELGSVAISGLVGGLAGSIKLPERFIGKGKTPKAKANTEVKEVVSQIKDTGVKTEIPEIKLSKPTPITDPKIKVEPNQPNIKLDLRKRPKNPMIMSTDSNAGRQIMEQILAESKASKIPQIDVQSPIVNTKTDDIKGSSIISWLNASKATAASADLSAPLRQGIFLVGRKAWWNAWKPMIQSLREGNYNRINNEIASHPKIKEATENGLIITTDKNIGTREEQFASKIAESIPLVGKYL